MTTKHTPGPWTAKFVPDYGEDAIPVIAVETLARDELVLLPLANASEEEAETAWADAHLIAAAPDMIAALIEAASLIPVAARMTHADTMALQRQIVAAIAKAKGEAAS